MLFVVQRLSHVQLFATPWPAARQASLSFTISQSLLKLMSIKSVMLSNHLILCHPLLLPPSISPSIRVFCRESAVCITPSRSWSFPSGLLSTPPDTQLPVHLCPAALGPCRVRAVWTPGDGGGVASRSLWEGLRGPVWTWPAPCSSASGSSEGSLGVTQRERRRGELCSPVTAALVSSRTCLIALST